MTNFNSLFRNLRRGESHLSTSCLLLASYSPLTCLLQLRYAAVVLFVFTFGVGNVWGADVTYTFTDKSWNATSGGSAANWTSGKDGAGFSNNGIQVTTAASGANGTSPISFTNVTKVICTYNTNKSAGAGTIGIKIGTNDEKSVDWAYSGSSDGRTANFTAEETFSPGQSGTVKITLNTTTNSIYLVSVTITTASTEPYTVTYNAEGGTCGTASATESTAGGGVTLPSASPSSACSSDGWAFYGWATSACGSVTAAAPEIVGTTDDTYHPTSNTTLHAVYRKSLGSSNYNRIVSLDDLSSGSDYIFVGEYSSANYVMTNSYSTSGDYGRFAGSQINESSTGMYSAASINSNYKLTITGTTDNYYIYCAANSKYVDVGYKAMIYGSKDADDYYQIIVSNGKWKTINHYNSNYILYDGSNNIFKGSSTEYELLIYKYGPSYSYYSSPSCCTPLGTINGSVSLSHFLHFFAFSYYISISKINSHSFKCL